MFGSPQIQIPQWLKKMLMTQPDIIKKKGVGEENASYMKLWQWTKQNKWSSGKDANCENWRIEIAYIICQRHIQNHIKGTVKWCEFDWLGNFNHLLDRKCQECLYSPLNYTISIFLFISWISKLFGLLKNKFTCFMGLFLCFMSCFLPNTSQNSKLSFLNNIYFK